MLLLWKHWLCIPTSDSRRLWCSRREPPYSWFTGSGAWHDTVRLL